MQDNDFLLLPRERAETRCPNEGLVRLVTGLCWKDVSLSVDEKKTVFWNQQ